MFVRVPAHDGQVPDIRHIWNHLTHSCHYNMMDHSDTVFYAAIALLPVDGTIIGGYMPFWTPISPWLFMLYAVLNWRLLPQVYRRFRMFFLFPAVLVALSLVGWLTVAFHPLPVAWSLLGVCGALACLTSLEITVHIKRLDWRPMIHLLIAAYWVAFAVGVVQFLAIKLGIGPVQWLFGHIMSREYISASSQWGGSRPQFLFAEPSYIGMHLYGVLLPLMWLMRGRDRVYVARLRDLIIVFALGGILMHAGVRIIIDTGVALVVAIVEATDFKNKAQARRAWSLFAALCVAGTAVMLANARVRSILAQGPVAGDESASARLSQSLTPLIALVQHPLNLFTGFGAGNIAEASRLGTTTSYALLNGPDAEIPWWVWKNWTPNNVITMSAYSSFLTEYGIIGFTALVWLVIRHVARHHAWNKTTVCWLALTAYLYIQFEGYAFYALPLFIWSLEMNPFTHEVVPVSWNRGSGSGTMQFIRSCDYNRRRRGTNATESLSQDGSSR